MGGSFPRGTQKTSALRDLKKKAHLQSRLLQRHQSPRRSFSRFVYLPVRPLADLLELLVALVDRGCVPHGGLFVCPSLSLSLSWFLSLAFCVAFPFVSFEFFQKDEGTKTLNCWTHIKKGRRNVLVFPYKNRDHFCNKKKHSQRCPL